MTDIQIPPGVSSKNTLSELKDIANKYEISTQNFKLKNDYIKAINYLRMSRQREESDRKWSKLRAEKHLNDIKQTQEIPEYKEILLIKALFGTLMMSNSDVDKESLKDGLLKALEATTKYVKKLNNISYFNISNYLTFLNSLSNEKN